MTQQTFSPDPATLGTGAGQADLVNGGYTPDGATGGTGETGSTGATGGTLDGGETGETGATGGTQAREGSRTPGPDGPRTQPKRGN